jgi:hypothetical protein
MGALIAGDRSGELLGSPVPHPLSIAHKIGCAIGHVAVHVQCSVDPSSGSLVLAVDDGS